jgi:hypothetical protein
MISLNPGEPSWLAVALATTLLVFMPVIVAAKFRDPQRVDPWTNSGTRLEKIDIGTGPRLWGFVAGDVGYNLHLIPISLQLYGRVPGRILAIVVGSAVAVAWSSLFVALMLCRTGLIPAAAEPGQRLEVVEVAAGGGAMAAGLRAGDIILAVNGRPVDLGNEVIDALSESQSEAQLSVSNVDDPEERTVAIRRGEGADSSLGLTLRRDGGAAAPVDATRVLRNGIQQIWAYRIQEDYGSGALRGQVRPGGIAAGALVTLVQISTVAVALIAGGAVLATLHFRMGWLLLAALAVALPGLEIPTRIAVGAFALWHASRFPQDERGVRSAAVSGTLVTGFFNLFGISAYSTGVLSTLALCFAWPLYWTL